jgi:hypothetical protein
VLKNQNAIDLAKDVANADAAAAERARQAMRLVIETAALKPSREPWSGSEELLVEARDVRTAFGALDSLDAGQRLDQPLHRVLRLEVDLAGGKFQEVVQRATAWLAANGNGNGGATPTNGEGGHKNGAHVAEYKDRTRVLAAEAQLALGRADAASKLLAERGPEAPVDAGVVDLMSRVARALAPADPARSVELFERAMRATPTEDPAFRRRLLDWMQLRLKQDPQSRESVVREASRHAALFEAQDCPAELRAQFEQLRSS